MKTANSYMNQPDDRGHFGPYGGRYVAETLMPLILSVEQAYKEARQDPEFWEEFEMLARDYIGRPSPLYFASAQPSIWAALKYISSVMS